MLHHLLRKKGTLELLLLFAVIVAVFLCLVSSAGAMDLGELDAKYHCVSGKVDNIKDQKGGPGEQDVTVDRGEMMVKLEKTPKDTFRAVVRYFGHLGYDIVVDYDERSEFECMHAIRELVKNAKDCELVKVDGWLWHEGRCDEEGKCTGGRLRVACRLSEVQQVQYDSGPTGYLVADVTVWSSEECLSVSAKFTDTDKNFCYLVPQKQVSDLKQIKSVIYFTGRTTTTKTTTTEITTEGSSNKTTMTIQNTTTAETKTTPANGTTKKKMTAQTTTTVDKHGPKPTTMGPAEEQEEHGDEDEQEEVSTSLPYCMALAWPFPLLFHLAINITVILVGVVLISLCMFSELIHERRR